jgi:PPM family protein phosphatase
MTESAAAPLMPTKGNPLRVRVAQLTDVGRVRSENQDFAIVCTDPGDGDSHLMVVADGMGGHRGGATASRLAAATIESEFFRSEIAQDANTGEVLRDALLQANAAIYAQAQASAELRGMGTTCSALAVRGGLAWIAHVGDSRVYMVRRAGISQLTEDHSLVASMVREGLLTTSEAEVHPRRNVLQRSVGVAEVVEIDLLDPIAVEVGDTFILCSDGLHGQATDEEMRQAAAHDPETAVRMLVDLALERGAPDNVTVVVARVEDVIPDEERDLTDVAATQEVEEAAVAGASESSRPQAAAGVRQSGGRLGLWLLVLLVIGAVIGLVIWYGY